MAYNHLGVTEKEYFGLQHGDESVDSPRWLESSKPIRKQLKELTAKCGDIEKGRDNTRIALSTW